MSPTEHPLPLERSTVFSAGPCPECADGGALLVLRRREDGALLFHCPSCGLSFLHEEEEGTTGPRDGRSLAALAPGGAEAASPDEIRGAGLTVHASPAYEGDLADLLAGRPASEGVVPRPRRIPWVPTVVEKEDPRLVILFLGLVGGIVAILFIEAWGVLSSRG